LRGKMTRRPHLTPEACRKRIEYQLTIRFGAHFDTLQNAEIAASETYHNSRARNADPLGSLKCMDASFLMRS
jgi:hypothetical protein